MTAVEMNLYEAEQVFRTTVSNSYGCAAIQDEALVGILKTVEAANPRPVLSSRLESSGAITR